jgi:hypothetical protein
MLVELKQGWYVISGIDEARVRKTPEAFDPAPDFKKNAPKKKKKGSAKKSVKPASDKVRIIRIPCIVNLTTPNSLYYRPHYRNR